MLHPGLRVSLFAYNAAKHAPMRDFWHTNTLGNFTEHEGSSARQLLGAGSRISHAANCRPTADPCMSTIISREKMCMGYPQQTVVGWDILIPAAQLLAYSGSPHAHHVWVWFPLFGLTPNRVLTAHTRVPTLHPSRRYDPVRFYGPKVWNDVSHLRAINVKPCAGRISATPPTLRRAPEAALGVHRVPFRTLTSSELDPVICPTPTRSI